MEEFDEIKSKVEYVGPKLGDNTICLPRNIQKVKYIALGEEHMMAHCTHAETLEDQIYVLGNNHWGQLGLNPFEYKQVQSLTPLKLQAVNDR